MSYSTLVSCGELASHLDDADWRVFDCRHQLSDVDNGTRAYAEGHLPGAFFLHLDRDLSSPMNGANGRHPWPDAQRLADRLGAAGVSPTTQVVVYDDAGGMVAARLWYLLRWLGHERVARRSHRPLLKDRDPGQVLRELAAVRNPIYAEAHIRVGSASSPHEHTVRAILEALVKWNG